MAAIIERFKSLPGKTRTLLSISMILALVVALPLFIWAIVNLNFNPFKKAATGEPGVCIPVNKVIRVTQEGDPGTCHNLQTAVNAVDGDGFRIEIEPGTYQIYSTVNVSGKTNLTITGARPEMGPNAVNLNSIPSAGWGILVENSTGTLQWLSMTGGSSNGMLSIQNSNSFNVGYTSLYSQTSHTFDIQNSNNIYVYNNEIQSSAGALEIHSSSYVSVMNNKIHNSANAVTVYSSSYFSMGGNLVVDNRESGLHLSEDRNVQILSNTFMNNGSSVPDGNVKISGNQPPADSSHQFIKNIIYSNGGPGIEVEAESGSPITLFQNNDVFSNNPNYQGYSNQTGINGNISADPRIDASRNYCLMPGSPALYGSVANGEYMGYIGSCGGASPTPIPTPSPTTSPTPVPSRKPLNFKVRFDGVNDGSAEGAKATIRFISGYINILTPPVNFRHTGNGIYEALVSPFGFYLPFMGTGNGYTIYVKGEKHISNKFCRMQGQIGPCVGAGNIPVPEVTAEPVSLYDFTGYPLQPGDLPPQNGVANGDDFAKIKSLLTKPCSELTAAEKATGDLDYNGCINIKDAFLMRKTLETRYDEY